MSATKTVKYIVLKLQKVLKSDQDVLLNSSKTLLKVRLWMFSIAWVHLTIAAWVILPTDMSGDADPRIRAFSRLKYRFITAWFNFIMLAYFPLCLYCDWREYRGDGQVSHVTLLRRIRDIVLTSILFPTTMMADILFWRLYLKDPELISPVGLFRYMPSWGQHSLHTVSLVVIILDLVLTPRSKPESVKSRLALLTVFLGIYAIVVGASYLNGDMVYQMLEKLDGSKVLLLCALVYIESLFYFFVQWLVIDYVWNRRNRMAKKKE